MIEVRYAAAVRAWAVIYPHGDTPAYYTTLALAMLAAVGTAESLRCGVALRLPAREAPIYCEITGLI